MEELQQDVDEYVEFFNKIRPHQRLGMQIPSETERHFAEKNKSVFWTFQQKVSKIPLLYRLSKDSSVTSKINPPAPYGLDSGLRYWKFHEWEYSTTLWVLTYRVLPHRLFRTA